MGVRKITYRIPVRDFERRPVKYRLPAMRCSGGALLSIACARRNDILWLRTFSSGALINIVCARRRTICLSVRDLKAKLRQVSRVRRRIDFLFATRF